MALILAGMIGFVFLILADRAEAAGREARARLQRLLALALIAPSFFILLFSGPRLPLSPLARLAAAPLALVSGGLLLRALWLDLRGTRAPGRGAARRLVRTGVYALSRHPGVLGLFGLHLALALLSASLPFLAALPAWTAMNALLAALQDRLYFPLLFGESYQEYKEEVPFLLPTRTSLRRFLAGGLRARRPSDLASAPGEAEDLIVEKRGET